MRNTAELHAFDKFKLIVKFLKNQPLTEVFSNIIVISGLMKSWKREIVDSMC